LEGHGVAIGLDVGGDPVVAWVKTVADDRTKSLCRRIPESFARFGIAPDDDAAAAGDKVDEAAEG
jgi:hypothetical protein